MSEPSAPPAHHRFSPFWPIAILGAAFFAFLLQVYWARQTEHTFLAIQIGQFQLAEGRVKEQGAKATQILTDLMVLAETDAGARAIVEKHRIQRHTPPATPTPPPAASAHPPTPPP
jgi:hypothetical protein